MGRNVNAEVARGLELDRAHPGLPSFRRQCGLRDSVAKFLRAIAEPGFKDACRELVGECLQRSGHIDADELICRRAQTARCTVEDLKGDSVGLTCIAGNSHGSVSKTVARCRRSVEPRRELVIGFAGSFGALVGLAKPDVLGDLEPGRSPGGRVASHRRPQIRCPLQAHPR